VCGCSGLVVAASVIACGDDNLESNPDDDGGCARVGEPVVRQTLASLAVGRTQHSVTQLANGDVLVAGGRTCGDFDSTEASVERYSFTRSRWETVASLPEPRLNHVALALPDGDLLLLGGRAADREPTAVLRYAAKDDAWVEIGALAQPMREPRAVLLPDGRNVIVGDISTDAWSRSEDAGVTWFAMAMGSGQPASVNTALVPLPELHVLNPTGEHTLAYDLVGDEWVEGPSVAGAGMVDRGEYMFVDIVAMAEQEPVGTIQSEPVAWLWDPVLDRRTSVGFASCPPTGDERKDLVRGVYARGGDAAVVEGFGTLARWTRPLGWQWLDAFAPVMTGRGVMLSDGAFMVTGGRDVDDCTRVVIWER
jgi:Kelch motif